MRLLLDNDLQRLYSGFDLFVLEEIRRRHEEGRPVVQVLERIDVDVRQICIVETLDLALFCAKPRPRQRRIVRQERFEVNGVLDLLHHGFTKSKMPVRNATIGRVATF